MNNDPRDNALQAATPTVMVPRFGTFEPLTEPGHRFLATADGLWLELKRAWLYLCMPLACQYLVAMPYGRVEESIDLIFGSVPSALMEEFCGQAKDRLPNEHAAWITWNEVTGHIRLRALGEISAAPGHIHFNRPVLAEGEHLVLDVHSHGTLPAFFSATDNRDDGEVKIAGVIGNLDTPHPTAEFRLCALGVFLPMPGTAKGKES